jgi:serine/threonine protein kinase
MSKYDVGEVIGERYAIKKSLGHGGMGEVYLVEDSTNGKELALKTLHPRYLKNKQAQARFVREVNTAYRLHHPGIVKVFDARQWQDTMFYTMEYVEGKTLREWLAQRGQLNLGSVVRVLCLVADALAHAHQLTIHRDLSPENIMVLKDGSIRILDFGLAKMDDKFKDLTVFGANLGKLAYIAPEQQIDAAHVDHRADIYPLGVMFFEMLTGYRPKPGQKITTFRPDLPPQADAFVAKAMAKEPDKRFPSAYAFRAELLALYEHANNWNGKKNGKHKGFFYRILSFVSGKHSGNGHGLKEAANHHRLFFLYVNGKSFSGFLTPFLSKIKSRGDAEKQGVA